MSGGRWWATVGALLLVAGCAVHRPPPATVLPWAQREQRLQQASQWALDGRAAVAVGTQGWQASLDWRQQGGSSEVHLAGPFGAGATMLTLGPDGLSVNGAAPSPDEQARLEEIVGFEMPMGELRYWLLGVPTPGAPVTDLERNALDRASGFSQEGWSLHFDRYESVGGDALPGLMRLERGNVRVRIAVDRWEGPR